MGQLAALMHRLGDAGALAPLVAETAARAGVDPALVMAVIQAESSFNARARGDDGQSWGLMQVTLATAKLLAGRAVSAAELMDPATNVALGTRYLADQLARYGGHVPDAIAAYNAGTARRNAAGQYVNSRGVTNVQAHVDRVLAAWPRYQGAAGVGETPLQTSAPDADAAAGAWWQSPWTWAASAVAAGLVVVAVAAD